MVLVADNRYSSQGMFTQFAITVNCAIKMSRQNRLIILLMHLHIAQCDKSLCRAIISD